MLQCPTQLSTVIIPRCCAVWPCVCRDPDNRLCISTDELSSTHSPASAQSSIQQYSEGPSAIISTVFEMKKKHSVNCSHNFMQFHSILLCKTERVSTE